MLEVYLVWTNTELECGNRIIMPRLLGDRRAFSTGVKFHTQQFSQRRNYRSLTDSKSQLYSNIALKSYNFSACNNNEGDMNEIGLL